MTDEPHLRPFMTSGPVDHPQTRLDPRVYMEHVPEPVGVTWGRDQFGRPELTVDQRCSCGSHTVAKASADIRDSDVLKGEMEQELIRQVGERINGHVSLWVG